MDTKPLCKEMHGGVTEALPNLCSMKSPGGEPVPQRLGKVITKKKGRKKKTDNFLENLLFFLTGICKDYLGKREGGW